MTRFPLRLLAALVGVFFFCAMSACEPKSKSPAKTPLKSTQSGQTEPGKSSQAGAPDEKSAKTEAPLPPAETLEERLSKCKVCFTIAGKGPKTSLIFVRIGGHTGFHPGIVIVDGKAWSLFELDAPEYKELDWVWAGVTAGSPHAFGVLASFEGREKREFAVLTSADGGRSWQKPSRILVPSSGFQFSAFRMNERGEGRLVLRIEENLDPKMPGSYYECATKDWGANWSEPETLRDEIIGAFDSRGETRPTVRELIERMKGPAR